MSAPHPSTPSAGRARGRPILARLDPGWLYLIPGLALLGALVLLPAQREADEARHQRDRALVLEAHHQQRVDRYRAFLRAVQDRDPVVLEALAATQLNRLPPETRALTGTPGVLPDATLEPALEPPPPIMPPEPGVNSRLSRWTEARRPRLILTAVGAMLVLIGLMPPTSRAHQRERAAAPSEPRAAAQAERARGSTLAG